LLADAGGLLEKEHLAESLVTQCLLNAFHGAGDAPRPVLSGRMVTTSDDHPPRYEPTGAPVLELRDARQPSTVTRCQFRKLEGRRDGGFEDFLVNDHELELSVEVVSGTRFGVHLRSTRRGARLVEELAFVARGLTMPNVILLERDCTSRLVGPRTEREPHEDWQESCTLHAERQIAPDFPTPGVVLAQVDRTTAARTQQLRAFVGIRRVRSGSHIVTVRGARETLASMEIPFRHTTSAGENDLEVLGGQVVAGDAVVARAVAVDGHLDFAPAVRPRGR
jgi:hypothetical protein